MKYLYFWLGLSLFGSAFQSCKKETANGGQNKGTETKISPDGFDFATSRNVEINLRLLSNNNQPLTGVVLNLYKVGSTSKDE
ncbi:MAG: hypothetical protein JWQ25_692, partial [Daejeonella sp.]|nr:hypothetical protein [Daejeonella sp.]